MSEEVNESANRRYSWSDEEEIVEKIKAGGIACMPTETVPGLFCAAHCAQRLNELKQRPADQPLTWMVANMDQVRELWGDLGEDVYRLAEHWPGALTLIAGKGPKLGLRMPDYPPLQALIEKTGPLPSTSANFTGKPAPKSQSELDEELLKGVEVVLLDPDLEESGVASSIFEHSGENWNCIRPGILSQEWMASNIHLDK